MQSVIQGLLLYTLVLSLHLATSFMGVDKTCLHVEAIWLDNIVISKCSEFHSISCHAHR